MTIVKECCGAAGIKAGLKCKEGERESYGSGLGWPSSAVKVTRQRGWKYALSAHIYVLFLLCTLPPPPPRPATTIYGASAQPWLFIRQYRKAGLHNMENASKQQLRVLIWLPLTRLTTWFKNNNTQSWALVGIIGSEADELLVVFSTSVSLIFPYLTLHIFSYPLSRVCHPRL